MFSVFTQMTLTMTSYIRTDGCSSRIGVKTANVRPVSYKKTIEGDSQAEQTNKQLSVIVNYLIKKERN